MTESLFPSGPWTGFYSYYPGDRHRMELQLTFSNGLMNGEGQDDIGAFFIRGRYEASTSECYWTKSYVGKHDLFYRGFREGKGIWGTWEISQRWRGGFHIWPRAAGAGDAEAEHEENPQPVDAVAVVTEKTDRTDVLRVGTTRGPGVVRKGRLGATGRRRLTRQIWRCLIP